LDRKSYQKNIDELRDSWQLKEGSLALDEKGKSNVKK
jgi:hypothetical protein